MKIDHIAIVVNDVESAAKQYKEALGIEPREVFQAIYLVDHCNPLFSAILRKTTLSSYNSLTTSLGFCVLGDPSAEICQAEIKYLPNG